MLFGYLKRSETSNNVFKSNITVLSTKFYEQEEPERLELNCIVLRTTVFYFFLYRTIYEE